MDRSVKILNHIYNFIFRIVTFFAMFYLISSLLFCIIPYSFLLTNDYWLLFAFSTIVVLSFISTKLIIYFLLRLQK